jgi:hypothetical protein
MIRGFTVSALITPKVLGSRTIYRRDTQNWPDGPKPQAEEPIQSNFKTTSRLY